MNKPLRIFFTLLGGMLLYALLNLSLAAAPRQVAAGTAIVFTIIGLAIAMTKTTYRASSTTQSASDSLWLWWQTLSLKHLLVFIVLIGSIGLSTIAWIFRYEPYNVPWMVWDRWTHQVCIATLHGKVECGQE